MSLARLKSNNQEAQEERTAKQEAMRDDVFRRKTQGQQFLKHHGALLRALIRIAGTIDLESNPGEFERHVLMARSLAVKIAARILDKPENEISMEEARPYRQECSEIVAWCWTEGEPLRADQVADEIAAAVRHADLAYDADTTPWRNLSNAGQIALTVVPVMMRLRSSVALYDFRLGTEAVLARLSAAVAEASMIAVRAILPATATESDRRSLFQSFLREYSSDLQTLYEEGARQTVDALLPLSEGERVQYLDDRRPLDAIIESFYEVARQNTQLNASAIRAMLEALSSSSHLGPQV